MMATERQKASPARLDHFSVTSPAPEDALMQALLRCRFAALPLLLLLRRVR